MIIRIVVTVRPPDHVSWHPLVSLLQLRFSFQDLLLYDVFGLVDIIRQIRFPRSPWPLRLALLPVSTVADSSCIFAVVINRFELSLKLASIKAWSDGDHLSLTLLTKLGPGSLEGNFPTLGLGLSVLSDTE
jgi:hypothetical protein